MVTMGLLGLIKVNSEGTQGGVVGEPKNVPKDQNIRLRRKSHGEKRRV